MTPGFTLRPAGRLFKRDGIWVEGSFEGRRYQAKVFDERSKFGIEGGRVSKLFVIDAAAAGWAAPVVAFDRGWDAGEDLREVWEPLVALIVKHWPTPCAFHNGGRSCRCGEAVRP